MAYLMGFAAAVPAANKEAYRRFAEESVPYFKALGVTRMVETWGDDVPRGENTDFYRALDARDGEVIVYSFQFFPDKATCDAANETMTNDPAMADMGARMPFDATRMIYGGFEIVSELRSEGILGYLDGSVIPVPRDRRDEYIDRATQVEELFKNHGAVRSVDAWGDNVPDGEVTDFKRAVAAREDETIVLSFIEWPSKEVRDRAWQDLFADPLMQSQDDTLFDEARRIYGGFVPILDV